MDNSRYRMSDLTREDNPFYIGLGGFVMLAIPFISISLASKLSFLDESWVFPVGLVFMMIIGYLWFIALAELSQRYHRNKKRG